jgi:hypothetical protein
MPNKDDLHATIFFISILISPAVISQFFGLLIFSLKLIFNPSFDAYYIAAFVLFFGVPIVYGFLCLIVLMMFIIFLTYLHYDDLIKNP